MVKTVQHPTVPHIAFRFGRRRPVAPPPRLSLKNYLLKSLPAPPPESDYYTTSVAAPLSQMYLNDQLGDCVIAELGHTIGVMTGNANGSAGASVFTPAQITALYSAIGGYVPGDAATDNGCVITSALAYWIANGLLPDGSHKIAGYLAIDGTNKEEVETAISVFENVDFGVELPDAWINPAPSASGFTWGVAGESDPENGHSFLGFSYDAVGVLISTWGMVGRVTWDAVAQYTSPSVGGELYTVVSQDQVSKARARTPAGLNWAQLESDFQALGGTLAKTL